MENIELIITLILAIFVALFGYKLKKIVFFVAWFLIGYLTMTNIMPFINNIAPVIAESNLWQTILPIAGGLILSLVGFSIEKLCVSLLCFAVIFLFGTQQFGWDIPVVIISAVVGVIAGAFAVRMIKPATIIASSAAGGIVITDIIFQLATSFDRATYYWPILIVVIVLAVVVQAVTNKNNE